MSLEEDLWLKLPSDILDIILSKIPLFYHPIFASVCKNWNAFCTHKLYPIDQNDPLLIHVKNWKSGFIHYYSPFWNKTFKVKSPIASQESHFFHSKYGWLVLYRKVLEEKDEVEVVLINPITNISYSYSGLLHDRIFTGITFSGDPGTEDFVLFGITSQEWEDDIVRICLWKEGEWKLNGVIFDNHSPFSMSPYSSPVEFKECFCCVSESGIIGIFMFENENWVILPKTKKFSTPIFSKERYLIETRDKIILVVGGSHEPRMPQVFYLDCKKSLWRKIENSNIRSIFVGPKASIAANFDKKEDDNETATIDDTVHGKKKCEGNGKKEVDSEVNGAKKSKVGEEVNVVKKEVSRRAETDKRMDSYEEKVDVNGKLMNDKVYSSGFYGDVEVVEAEMKISDEGLFFVTKACDHRRSKNVPRKGNVVSYSLKDRKITGKYHGLSYPLYCAWYRPDISCGLQGQEIEK